MAAPILGCARVNAQKVVTSLDPRPAPDVLLSNDDVQDASKLTSIVRRILDDVAALRARWYPRRIDFEDIALPNAGGLVTLQHNFGGRVRYWVVDNIGASNVLLQRNAATTADILVLSSNTATTATIRVEEAGG